MILGISLLSFDKVQQKFGKICDGYKNLPSLANILKDFVGGKNLFSLVQSTLDLTDLDLTDFGFYRSVSIDCCTCNCYKRKSIADETRNRATLSQRHNDSPFTCIVTSQDVSVCLFSLFCSLSFCAVIITNMPKQAEKRKRVNLSVTQKLELIEKIEKGASVAIVCEQYSVKKRFRLTDFFQQRTVVGPHLSVKPRFDCS